MLKVLYVGDQAVINHTFMKARNTFSFSEILDDGNYLVDALDASGDIEVEHLQTSFVPERFPKTIEEISKYDVVIISDVSTDSLLLYPDMFKVPMGPNRLELIKEYVMNGGGFALVGGWMSYGGYMGQGKYSGTVIEDVLNVAIKPYDDRVEVPEAYKLTVTNVSHPLTKDIGWDSSPLLFVGYNRVEARDQKSVLAVRNNDPIITINSFGKGRALAFTSDLAPHWGQGFCRWENYGKFWSTAVKWLAGELS